MSWPNYGGGYSSRSSPKTRHQAPCDGFGGKRWCHRLAQSRVHATTEATYTAKLSSTIVEIRAMILRRLWPGVIDICILKLRSKHSLRSQIITLQLMAISWHAPGPERVFTARTAPNNCIYQLSRIPFALLRFKIFLPVRVRSLDKKPCLRFTTRRVALFVGLLDLCRTCDTDEVTAGPRIEAGEGVMVGD
jgi:hypothetical protein